MKRSFFFPCSSANAKSTLTLGVAIVCLAGMYSCSDDMDAPGQGDSNVPSIEKSALTVTSDADYLSQYVTNYRVASRAADDSMFDFIMESAPTVPADAKSVLELNVNDNTVNLDNQAKAYIIPAGEKYTGKMNIDSNDIEIYIQGDFDGTLVGNNNSCVVYLLPGANWTNANNDVQPAWSIYKFKGSDITFIKDIDGWKGKLYADELVTDKNVTVTNGGVLYIEEGLIASDISINSGAKFTAHCVEGEDVYFTNGTDIYISAYINATNLKLDSQTKLHMRGAGFINVEKYLMCGNVNKSGDSDRFVNEGSEPCVIATDYYFACGSNQGDGTCSIANNLSGDFKFYIKQGVVNTFKWYTPAKLSEIPGQLGGLDSYTFDALTKDAQTELFAEGIAPVYDSCTAAVQAQMPAAPSQPDVLELISKVELDHKHPISATCIDLNGNQAFVSWHERGNNMKGCIEILNVTSPDAVTFEAWMETPEWKYGTPLSSDAYDFNHLIYDQRTQSIITVGDHSKKGGFVAQIPLANLVSGVYEQQLDIMIPRQIPFAASGNSVIRYGEDLYIAGAGGYSIFPFGNGEKFPIVNTDKADYTQKSECDSLATAGSAKHLAINGDKIATIEYTARGAEKLPAKISLWDASSWIKGSPIMEKDLDESFGPTYGKDVIALDDQYIYSCQGTNGMAVYDLSGQEVARFKVNDYLTKDNGFTDADRNKMRNSAANGLCLYGDYVFVANGGAGVWVLSKAKNFEPVAHFTDGGEYFTLENEETEKIGASANFVRVTSDGYVYVAYGLGGVMVLKFNETALK